MFCEINWMCILNVCLRSLDFALCLPDSGVSPEIYEGVHAGVPQGHQEKHGVDVSKNVTKNNISFHLLFMFIFYESIILKVSWKW